MTMERVPGESTVVDFIKWKERNPLERQNSPVSVTPTFVVQVGQLILCISPSSDRQREFSYRIAMWLNASIIIKLKHGVPELQPL